MDGILCGCVVIHPVTEVPADPHRNGRRLYYISWATKCVGGLSLAHARGLRGLERLSNNNLEIGAFTYAAWDIRRNGMYTLAVVRMFKRSAIAVNNYNPSTHVTLERTTYYYTEDESCATKALVQSGINHSKDT